MKSLMASKKTWIMHVIECLEKPKDEYHQTWISESFLRLTSYGLQEAADQKWVNNQKVKELREKINQFKDVRLAMNVIEDALRWSHDEWNFNGMRQQWLDQSLECILKNKDIPGVQQEWWNKINIRMIQNKPQAQKIIEKMRAKDPSFIGLEQDMKTLRCMLEMGARQKIVEGDEAWEVIDQWSKQMRLQISKNKEKKEQWKCVLDEATMKDLLVKQAKKWKNEGLANDLSCLWKAWNDQNQLKQLQESWIQESKKVQKDIRSHGFDSEEQVIEEEMVFLGYEIERNGFRKSTLQRDQMMDGLKIRLEELQGQYQSLINKPSSQWLNQAWDDMWVEFPFEFRKDWMDKTGFAYDHFQDESAACNPWTALISMYNAKVWDGSSDYHEENQRKHDVYAFLKDRWKDMEPTSVWWKTYWVEQALKGDVWALEYCQDKRWSAFEYSRQASVWEDMKHSEHTMWDLVGELLNASSNMEALTNKIKLTENQWRQRIDQKQTQWKVWTSHVQDRWNLLVNQTMKKEGADQKRSFEHLKLFDTWRALDLEQSQEGLRPELQWKGMVVEWFKPCMERCEDWVILYLNLEKKQQPLMGDDRHAWLGYGNFSKQLERSYEDWKKALEGLDVLKQWGKDRNADLIQMFEKLEDQLHSVQMGLVVDGVTQKPVWTQKDIDCIGSWRNELKKEILAFKSPPSEQAYPFVQEAGNKTLRL